MGPARSRVKTNAPSLESLSSEDRAAFERVAQLLGKSASELMQASVQAATSPARVPGTEAESPRPEAPPANVDAAPSVREDSVQAQPQGKLMWGRRKLPATSH